MSEGKNQSEYNIMMSDADGMAYYTLLGQVGTASDLRTINCVTEYTLSGGPETPFEILTMTIPKQKLSRIAPDLVDGIKAGRNEVIIDAVGKGHFTVVKCKYSSRKYKVTAYCNAERYKGCSIEAGGTDTPRGWLENIFADASYGVTLSNIVIDPSEDAVTDPISFEGGTTIWYILQVCTILLGCKIWFAEDTAYVMDCTKLTDGEELDLYPEDETVPMYARTVGEVTLGSEGTDTLINSVSVKCTIPVATMEGASETKQATIPIVRNAKSIAIYGEAKSGTLVVPELKEGEFTDEDGNTEQYSQGSAFARNYMKYFLEPQQSVSFELKEMELTSGEGGESSGYAWVPFWDLPAYCKSISDAVDEFKVTCTSVIDGMEKPEKLLLSSYTRNYPDGTTEYTFGQIKSIDLSSSTSQIVTALYN